MENMIRLFIYPILAVVILFVVLPVHRLYTADEGKNDCMMVYVELSKKYGVEKGNIYRLEDGSYHVEHIFSENVQYLEPMKIGEINGCNNVSDDGMVDLLNNAYCKWAFILK